MRRPGAGLPRPLPSARRAPSALRALLASRRSAAVLALAAAVGGCSTLQYYGQAIAGQFEIITRASPVTDELDDPSLPPATRARLRQAVAIRDFASRELGLPDNSSYRRYADLGRSYVLWNVVAADEFSVKAKESCFPVAGCVAYRGFYAESGARDYAAALARDGEDVFVYGVPAYSTLGWFSDPLLNTFIAYPPTELARLLFHELAHQLVYVPGDSAFNESFAVAVEDEGVRRWIAERGSEADRQAYEAMQERRRGFNGLVLGYQARLAALYASGMDRARMREAKREAFAQMKQSYVALRESWHGWSGYDHWFAQDLNNAHLASVATYTQWVGAFRGMIARAGGRLPEFYDAVRALARLDPAKRDAQLTRWERAAASPAGLADGSPAARD